MELNNNDLFEDSLWNLDEDWAREAVNQVREWNQIKNVLRTNKGKPKANHFNSNNSSLFNKQRSCSQVKNSNFEFSATWSLSNRIKWYPNWITISQTIKIEGKIIEKDHKRVQIKKTATKLDEYVNDISPIASKHLNKSESPSKLRKARLLVSNVKDLDSTRIISKLQDFNSSLC